MAGMGLFSRHPTLAVDLRDRDYLLQGCPLVTQDELVVIADLVVRLAVRRPADGETPVLGYRSADEPAMHAVCVTVLRLMAAGLSAEELLVGRAGVTEAVERALSFAPVGAGVDAHVLRVEVRPHDPTLMTLGHEFRVVTS